MARRIAVLTGARSDYGVLLSALRAIDAHRDLDLKLVVTGGHLSARHGMTVDQIENDGWEIAGRAPILDPDADDDDLNVARATGRGVAEIAAIFASLSPDVTLFLGDRYETFSGALAAATLRLPIGHIGGGECDHATCLDGTLRNALTQLAHVHFVACETYADRLVALGQDAWRVHVVGLPSLDGLTEGLMTREALAGSLGVRLGSPLIAGTYLPVTLRPDESRSELRAMLAALDAQAEATVVLTSSNADAGGGWVDAAIRSFASTRERVHVFESLGQQRYASLLSMADAVIGNSSSGLIETPSFGVPTINIGVRQEGRLRADNVIDVPGRTDAICAALDRALHDAAFRSRASAAVNPFGDGHAGERIAGVLAELTIDQELLEKRVPSGPCGGVEGYGAPAQTGVS